MKVLHIIVGLSLGGAERMLQRLVLQHRLLDGSTHIVVSLSKKGPIGAELEATGVPVVALNICSPRDLPIGLVHLFRVIRRLSPDIVQTWMYHADLLGGIMARMAGVRAVIWGVRTTEIARDGAGTARYIRRLCAWLSRVVPATVVCAAQASCRNHIGMGYHAPRMTVVSNGFDVVKNVPLSDDAIIAFRQSQGLDGNHVVMGFVGRFNGAKDLPNFVAAAARVAKVLPAARFLMIGTGITATNERLSHAISSSGFADRFLVLGERSDVARCLGAMDVFCLSSRTEGFPNVVGEAMSMGVPCVVTDVGDAALIVGDTGIVVPKEDASALADGMLHLAQMPRAARVALGRRARHRIESQFSMDEAVRKFDGIYRETIARTNRA